MQIAPDKPKRKPASQKGIKARRKEVRPVESCMSCTTCTCCCGLHLLLAAALLLRLPPLPLPLLPLLPLLWSTAAAAYSRHSASLAPGMERSQPAACSMHGPSRHLQR